MRREKRRSRAALGIKVHISTYMVLGILLAPVREVGQVN